MFDRTRCDSEDSCVLCLEAKCGDGHVEEGVEACDDAAEPKTCAGCVKSVCGDHIPNPLTAAGVFAVSAISDCL